MLCINKKCGAELVEGSVYCHVCGKKQTPEPRKRRKRANGSGTVYKLSGRRRRPWVAAKGGVILDYFETQTAATEFLNKLTGKTITDRFNMTFSEVYELWKAEHFRELKSNKGVEQYETAYKHFKALHDMKFRDIRSEHYQKEIDKLIDLGRSHSTTNKLKQLAGQMSKWAMREEIIPINYAQFIKLQENKAAEKEIFTKDEIEKLFQSPDDAAKITLMLMYTGMRIGELFSLETANVFEKHCIGGEKTEAGKNRVIPIPPEVRNYFAYFKERAKDELLISGYDGNRDIDNFRNRDYYGLLDALGISRDKSPHSTRHTFASMARDSGVKPEHLQKILGHAQYTTTADIYVHAEADTLIKAAEKIGGNKRVANKSSKSKKQKTP